MRRSLIQNNWWLSDGAAFDPLSIESMFAGYWVDEGNPSYLTDQLRDQEREALTQNSQVGQLFPGRAIRYESSADYSIVQDNGGLDIGTAPFSMSFWIYFDTFTGFSRIGIGKYVNGSTSGEYYFTTGGSAMNFVFRTSAGVNYGLNNIITSVSTGVWYHIIIDINADGTARSYRNNVLNVATVAYTGTFGTIANTTGFGVNTATPLVSSPTGYGAIRMRDLRIFKGKSLTAQERTDAYYGRHVSGFTEWYPMSDNSTLRTHSARSGGRHMTNVSFAAGNFVTGNWRQLYNEYGYAEDSTYGQIPPDLTLNQEPTIDCYGNALVFKGSAKINLLKSGTDYIFPDIGAYSVEMEKIRQSCDVIGLNQWFNGTTPQAVAQSSVAEYCGSRQFFKDGKLIIINSDYVYDDTTVVTGSHLTASQENSIMTFMGSTIPTTYHANTDALILRFTNSYSAKELSRIDNVMRLLVRNSLYDKLESFVLAATSGVEEQLLDWIDPTYNVVSTGVGGNVDKLPYRGLVPQKGNYRNNFVPSAATKFLQNTCFLSFKLADDQKIPTAGNRVIGSENTSVSVVNAGFNYGTNGNAQKTVTCALNTTGSGVGVVIGNNVETNRTFVGSRTASNAMHLSAKRRVQGTSTQVSVARNSIECYIGNVQLPASARYITHNNFFQHFAFGSDLSTTQSVLLAAIVDNFCNGQLALADEWIVTSDYRYKQENRAFIDRKGNQCLWSDYERLYYSTDGGVTVAASIAFDSTTLGWFQMAHIFDDGKIVLGTFKNKFYKTTTALSSVTEIVPTKNGVTYTPHTPANATYPGEYTKFLGPKKSFYLGDGTEIFIYTNYGTSLRGPAPSLVWYSMGEDMKVAYEFGTNPYLRDNGTANGGTTGTFLGDAAISNWARHGHGIQQRSDNVNKFISMWGDLDRATLAPAVAPFTECKFMEHTYDPDLDTWTHTIVKEGTQSNRWKATAAQMPGDGYIYWASDAGITGSNQAELGYWKSLITNLGDGSETRFYVPLSLTKPSNMFHLGADGFFMGGGYASTGVGFFDNMNVIWSDDMVNFNEVTLKLPGDVYCFKITKIATKKYQLDWMVDYDYYAGSQSVIMEFN